MTTSGKSFLFGPKGWRGFVVLIFWPHLMGLVLASVPKAGLAQDGQLAPPALSVEQTVDDPLVRPSNSSDIPQSSVLWQYPHTPFKVRFGFFVGDHMGGPIRFNTRFPEIKSDPHPASYFHSLASAGGEMEYAMTSGGILVGAIFRRDLWHKGIVGRSLTVDGEVWQVDDFSVNSTAFTFGWVFGERYREVPWSADISLVYDRGSADAVMMRSSGTTAIAQSYIEALTLRSRFHFHTRVSTSMNISAGPDIYVPMWQYSADRSDEALRAWFSEKVQLKSSSALGLSVMGSYRF